MQHWLWRSRLRALAVLAGAALAAACGGAQASFLDNQNDLNFAVSVLRSAIGQHPRVLKIEVDADVVAIEAQDAHNRNHVDRWQYGKINYLGIIPVRRLAGPEAVDLQLINPDLEANLFDLDAVDFSAAPKLMTAAISRAHLQDAAVITRLEIARQTFLLPKPSSGDIRWRVHVDSGRERAEIFANAEGVIVGSDLSGTHRAQTLNLLAEPQLAADAAAAFRAAVGAGPVLTAVGIDAKTVSFATNMPDQSLGKIMTGMPATASFTWDLDGLRQRLGSIDVNAEIGKPGPAPFSVDDVNWTVLAKLETDALAKVAIPKAGVTHTGVAKSSERPGDPVLVWTIEITDPGGEVTSVIADTGGVIERVVLPLSRRPKANWLDPATIAGAVSRVGSLFGPNAKIASMTFDDRGGRITVDDPANGGHPATFDFSTEGVTRAAISFSFDAMGPRFAVGDLAPLTEQKFAALEAEAMKKLGGRNSLYLESVSIGAHAFVRQAGAHAVEIRVRDVAQDSVSAHYAWMVFDFGGRVLDFVTF
jgi:hypothetical protein